MTTQQIFSDETTLKPLAFVYVPSQEFLLPYFMRELTGYRVITDIDQAENGETPELCIMISNTDIYDVTSGENHDENTPLKENSEFSVYENKYREYCKQHNLPCTILRGANIVGTGMNGFPMRLARGISRGMLFLIKGNEARINVVHATDIAKYGVSLAHCGEVMNITDGSVTPVNALIEALAYRIDNKRIYTIKPRWARWLYGKNYYTLLTTTLTFNNAKFERLSNGAVLNKVTDYLTTHVYDHESL